jgi:hypothetical protein
MESTIGDVRPLISEQDIPSSATTEVCQRVPEPINGLQKYLHETPSIYSKYNEGSTNYVELPDGNYTFVNANANETNEYKWVYVIDSKKCWTGYLFALGYERAGRITPIEEYDPTQLTLEVINASPQRFDENIGGVYNWKESKYPKSPAKGVTVREQEIKTTPQTNIIEITDQSVIPQSLIDNPPIPGTFDSNKGTHDDKGQYMDISDTNGTTYRIRNWGSMNFAGHSTQGKITSEYNSLLANTQDIGGKPAEAYFKQDAMTGSEVVPNNKNKWIGFKSSDKTINFACFTDNSGKITCKEYIWRLKTITR